MSSTRYTSIWGWLLLASLGGCREAGPQIAPVSGRVTLDGQPLFEAEVMFQPEGVGSPSYGFTDEEGRYELGYNRDQQGALIGWHRVTIEMDTEIAGPDGKPVHRKQLVPPRFNRNSELRREVKSDEANELDFDLTTNAE